MNLKVEGKQNPLFAFLNSYGFYLALALWFGCHLCIMGCIRFFGISAEVLEKPVEVAVFLLLAAQIGLGGRYSRRECIVYGVSAVLFAVSSLICKNHSLAFTWMFLLAARGQDLDRAAFLAYGMMAAVTLTVFLLFALGVQPDVTLKGVNGAVRHSMGFAHPNTLGTLFMQMTATRLYLRRKHLNTLDIAASLASFAFVYLVPFSRSAMVCMVLIVMLAVFTKIGSKMPASFRGALMLLMIAFALACNVFTVAASIGYRDTALFRLLDKLLTKRLSYANIIYGVYGIPLIGRNLAEQFSDAVYNGVSFWMPFLDSGYMNLLLRYGLAPYILYSGVYLLAMLRMARKKEFLLVGLLAVYAAHSVMEPSLYELKYNFLLVTLTCALPELRRKKTDLPE